MGRGSIDQPDGRHDFHSSADPADDLVAGAGTKSRNDVPRGGIGRNLADGGIMVAECDRSMMNAIPEARAQPFPSGIQGRLDAYNRLRLRPAIEPLDIDADEERELAALELAFVEAERHAVSGRAAQAPSQAGDFIAWFESLAAIGEGQNDRLFDWLATDASLGEMKWFLGQEIAGEAGFDDLVALTQVKMPDRVKLELARNYWDELGRGHAGGMHGPMLGRLAHALCIDTRALDIVWESLALGNLMIALALRRRYAYQSIGALGVIELTAPGRAAKVNAGLDRLGVGGSARRYFALHATLDVKHSAAWSREVLHPLVDADARIARPIAEGALMRLRAGRRCFERYRKELACH